MKRSERVVWAVLAVLFIIGFAGFGGQAPNGQATSNFSQYYNPAAVAITGGSMAGVTISNSPISGNTGSFSTLAASSTVSGAGFSTYLASPPAIGGTAPAAVSSTNLSGQTITGNGSGATTFSGGVALGSGGLAPACYASHVCDSFSGQFAFTTATSATSGTIVTIALGGYIRTNQVNCSVSLYNSTTGAQVGVYAFNNTTTQLVLSTAGAALSNSTAYVGTYVCGGN